MKTGLWNVSWSGRKKTNPERLTGRFDSASGNNNNHLKYNQMKANEENLKQKRKVFHVLLAKSMMLQAKPYMLESYGVESTLDLSESALDELIARVRRIMYGKEEDTDKTVRELRHKCLRIISEIGIDTKDWENVNWFMMNPHVCGRMLYELDEEGLRALRMKLYAIRDEVERRRITSQEAQLKEQRLAALN